MPEPTALDALDAVVRDGRIVLVEPDGAHVRAVDVETGEVRWRAPTHVTPDAAVIHDLGEGHLLIQLPSRLVTVDVATGRVLAEREGLRGWRFVFRNAGACALNGECDFAPIACDDGRPLGPTLSLRVDEWSHFEGGSYEVVCGGERRVIGRAGSLSLYVVETEEPPEVVAIADDGTVRWRDAGVACEACAPLGVGVSPDGSLCWTSDATERSLVVRAFDCATGRPRFSHGAPIPDGHRAVVGWVESPPGLLVSVASASGPGRATRLSVEGDERWSRDLAAGTLGVTEGLVVSSHPVALAGVERVARLRGRDGAVLEAEAAGGRDLRAVEGTLRFVPSGGSSERGGARVPPLRVFRFERDRGGSRALLGGRPVLELPGDGWVLAEHRSGERAWLVVAEDRGDRPDRVHVLRSGPDAGTRSEDAAR
ncbi:MAG TPA: PQQ-binding-like beta-propeller repeat protein [Sandaracinaceae bacterium LLY-WYZ-13_1]|nr:PQQ-binding-like beta-propeller repeat protein [Sandaracinaceae bacterium LLY-WYZ-13_1]